MGRDAVVKVRYDATGVVKVSTGLAAYNSRTPPHTSPPLSIAPNFKDEEDYRISSDFPVSDDCPPAPELRPGWGLLGKKEQMSAKTSRNVRRRMCATELHYGKDNCLFITLTVPTDCPRGFELIARYSSMAVNAISVWLNDRFGSGDISRVGVWEYQKRGALHYHLLLGGTCIGSIDLDDFRCGMAGAWMSTLERVEREDEKRLFLKEGRGRDKSRLLIYEDLGKRFCNVQRVEHSVSGYLSWYLSESNHDSSSSSKNSVRKDNYSIATWAQWNRRSTSLDREYSYALDMHVEGHKLPEVEACFVDYMDSLDKPDGTEIVMKDNDYYRVTTCISSNHAKEVISDLREMCPRIRRRFENKDKVTAKGTPWKAFIERYRVEADRHDYDLYMWEVKLDAKRKVIEPFMWHVFMMYLHVEKMGVIMDRHKRFSATLENHIQTELNLCLEKREIWCT